MDRSNIVPFGKYKGQPLQTLLDDPDYALWLGTQDWFRDRYAEIHAFLLAQAKSETASLEAQLLPPPAGDPSLDPYLVSSVAGTPPLHATDGVYAVCGQTPVHLIHDGERWLMVAGNGKHKKRRKDFASPFLAHAIRTAVAWYGPARMDWQLEPRPSRTAREEERLLGIERAPELYSVEQDPDWEPEPDPVPEPETTPEPEPET